MKPLVISPEDLYALIGQQHVELIVLRKRVIELEAAHGEASANGKSQEERQEEGQAVQG